MNRRWWPGADVVAGMRLLSGLPGFLQERRSLDQDRDDLAGRLRDRGTAFSALVREVIYGQTASPYRALLRHAGCEYGDLDGLVRRDGVEGALQALLKSGVYLTVEELKGRRPVVRGGLTLEVSVPRLRNPWLASPIPARSSGSRGDSVAVGVDFAFLRDVSVNYRLAFAARGGQPWVYAVWGVPGGAALGQLLWLARIGGPPARWFSQIDPGSTELHPRYRWSGRVARLGAILAGVRLPRPEHVPPDEPGPVVDWMSSTLRSGRTPHLLTFASSAVRLCRAARQRGIDLSGAHVTMSGEPTTPMRLAEVRRAGVTGVPYYGSSEAGAALGYGCLAPFAADEVHLAHDLFAFVQPSSDDAAPAGIPPSGLLVTSLRRTAPLILLNVSLGDRATIGPRTCGCPLERLGWTLHAHDVRSHEKLTAGGMAFLDVDLVRVLEEVLPARFGGGPTDYQLVEEDDPAGQPRLHLVVHPSVAVSDSGAVAEAFFGALGGDAGPRHVTAMLWRRSELLVVERRPPETSRAGKILHLCVPAGAARRIGTDGAGSGPPAGERT